jgi:predicted transcriptional regulator
MWVLTPLYKEIGACFMGDGWQSTNNRPILNILTSSDGFINVHRVFDASGQDKIMSFIANSMVTEMHTLGQENVFSFTMHDVCKDTFPIIQEQLPWV